MLKIVIWHLFGDLSQSENLSEIKPPLAEVVWTEDAKTLKFLRGTVSFEKSSKSGVRCNVTHGKIFQQSTYPLYFWHGTYYIHTSYSWNIMCQKWEGDCDLWDLNEIIKKIYTESLKKIVGAVWELPAK